MSDVVATLSSAVGGHHLRTLVACGRLAPSGDNTQPWRFEVDELSNTITVHVDESRDLSPMNHGQRMSRMAVGAAVENILQAVEANGCKADLSVAEKTGAASVHLESPCVDHLHIPEALERRVTNRRPYNGLAVPENILHRLEMVAMPEGVRAQWIVRREQIDRLAEAIGEADALMLGHQAMRRAFVDNIRFESAADESVEEGLSLASLELPRSAAAGLRLMARTPDSVLRLLGGRRQFAGHARSLVKSSAGLCIGTAADRSHVTDVRAGQGMERIWLALTSERLAAQPMMSLPVLDNARDCETLNLPGARIDAITEQIRLAISEIGRDRVAFVLRFGYAEAPSGRTGRLPQP